MKKIAWNENGWTSIQDADASKHILEISCRAENGTVVEIRFRHNDGEEEKGTALFEGKNVLPLPMAEFKEYFKKGKLEFK